MERTKIFKLLKSETAMDKVLIMGWVRTRRDSKTFSFIELNDGSCLKNIQIIADSDLKNYDEICKITTGSAVSVTGALVESQGGGQKWEIRAEDVDIISTHATSTPSGDPQECEAIREVFRDVPTTFCNNTKSMIGHCMGAAGVLELAGNLPAFQDSLVHPTINVDELDPKCQLPNLVVTSPKTIDKVDIILNNSFGMLGINSTVIVKKSGA